MKNQMKKILLAVAMVVVVAAGLLVYSSGKTASKGTPPAWALPKALAAM